MPYNNADLAVVLPSTQPAVGQVMQNAIGLAERQQARQDNIDERRYESEQRNELARQNKMQSNALHNLGTINKYVAEYKPIEASVDELVSTNIKGYKDFLMQNIGKDPIELDRLMSERTPAIANAYKKMQSDLPLMKQQEADFLKQMPNADPIALREVIRNQFKQRYTSLDKNGNEILKEPMETVYDYTKIFQDPEKLSWVVGNNQQPLKDFFDKVKYEEVSGNEYRNNKGQVIGKKWSGYKTPYSGALGVDEKGFPKIDVDYKEIPMKNGTLQIAGETLRNDMKANPAVERTFDIAWLNKKKEKGLTNIDAATDEKMKEAYRLEYARQHIKHNVKTSEIEKTPVIKISTGNSGSGSASSDVEIKDVFNELVANIGGRKSVALNKLPEAQQKAILSAARGVSGGIEEPVLDAEGNQAIDLNSGKPLTRRRQIDQRDITVGVEDGKVKVFGVNKKDEQAVRGDEIVTLGFYDVNAKSNKGVKATQAVIKADKKQPPKVTTTVVKNLQGALD